MSPLRVSRTRAGRVGILLDAGTLIAGRYEIVSQLGGGGGGLVFSAVDRTTEKRVAVKLLLSLLRQDRISREKFELEARVAGRLESDHIVQVSDAGFDPLTQAPFLVMEFLKGKDFGAFISQQGPVEPVVALEYLRQIASGLDKAHAWRNHDGKPAPIVHRDLKPENVFLTHRDDGTPLVKILDWGIAKVLSGSATLSQDLRGTPLYMAPEQLSQDQVTPATDIWALGLLAYYFVAGQCYWTSAHREPVILPAVIKEVCDGPIRLPSVRLRELGWQPALAKAFDEWFLHCVNLAPQKRYQWATEAVEELARALGCATPGEPDRRSRPSAASLDLHAHSAPVVMADSSAGTVGSGSGAPALTTPRLANWTLLLLLTAAGGVGATVAWFTLAPSNSNQNAAPLAVTSAPTPSVQPTAHPSAPLVATATPVPLATLDHSPASSKPSVSSGVSLPSQPPTARLRVPERSTPKAQSPQEARFSQPTTQPYPIPNAPPSDRLLPHPTRAHAD